MEDIKDLISYTAEQEKHFTVWTTLYEKRYGTLGPGQSPAQDAREACVGFSKGSIPTQLKESSCHQEDALQQGSSVCAKTQHK